MDDGAEGNKSARKRTLRRGDALSPAIFAVVRMGEGLFRRLPRFLFTQRTQGQQGGNRKIGVGQPEAAVCRILRIFQRQDLQRGGNALLRQAAGSRQFWERDEAGHVLPSYRVQREQYR